MDGAAHVVPYNPTWFDFGRVVRQPGKLPRDLATPGSASTIRCTPRATKTSSSCSSAPHSSGCWGATRITDRLRGVGHQYRVQGGEEFPWFTDFWLVRPTDPEQRTLTLYALLDSESISGAYQFIVRPGSITQVEVTSTLFPRRSIAKLGIAPLTSMFPVRGRSGRSPLR